jgi:hypothetical protein
VRCGLRSVGKTAPKLSLSCYFLHGTSFRAPVSVFAAANVHVYEQDCMFYMKLHLPYTWSKFRHFPAMVVNIEVLLNWQLFSGIGEGIAIYFWCSIEFGLAIL